MHKNILWWAIAIAVFFIIFIFIRVFAIRGNTQWHPLWNYVWSDITQAVLVQPDKWLSQLWSASNELVPAWRNQQMETIQAMVVWQSPTANWILVAWKNTFDPTIFQNAINTDSVWLPYIYTWLRDDFWLFSQKSVIDTYDIPDDLLIKDSILSQQKESFADAIIGIISRVDPDASPIPYNSIVRLLQESKYFSFTVWQQNNWLVTQANLLYRQPQTLQTTIWKTAFSYYNNPALLGVVHFADIAWLWWISPADVFATLQAYIPWASFSEDDIRSLHATISQPTTLSIYQSIGAEPLSAFIQTQPLALWERITNNLVLPFSFTVETTNETTDISIWQSIKKAGDNTTTIRLDENVLVYLRLQLLGIEQFIQMSQGILWPIAFDLSSITSKRIETLEWYITENRQWISWYGILQ